MRRLAALSGLAMGLTAFPALVAGGLVLSAVTGCASGRAAPELRPEVVATLPAQPPPDVVAKPGMGKPGREFQDESSGPPSRAADVENCACTLEYRMNLCITVDGARELPGDLADVSFARVREGGAADTLSAAEVAGGARCFGEWRGLQRVLMLRAAAVIDSSGWFEVQTVDCCHGEARTVDFKQSR